MRLFASGYAADEMPVDLDKYLPFPCICESLHGSDSIPSPSRFRRYCFLTDLRTRYSGTSASSTPPMAPPTPMPAVTPSDNPTRLETAVLVPPGETLAMVVVVDELCENTVVADNVPVGAPPTTVAPPLELNEAREDAVTVDEVVDAALPGIMGPSVELVATGWPTSVTCVVVDDGSVTYVVAIVGDKDSVIEGSLPPLSQQSVLLLPQQNPPSGHGV